MILAAVAKTATPPIDWVAIWPVAALVVTALVIVMVRALVRHSPRVYDASIILAVVGLGVAGLGLAEQWVRVREDGPYQAIAKMVAVDGFSVFVGTVVLLATLMAILLSSRYLVRERLDAPEYLALLLLSASGMLAMAGANDLLVVFVALELLSIPLYVLAAFARRRATSLEAGMKYFLLGAFSSAVLLYGIALIYGATGTTSLTGIADYLARTTIFDNGTLLAGIALLLVGLGFKVAAAPFHMWTPDVYQGAPTPITAFMASATKAAGFAALLRVLFTAFATYQTDWRPIIWALAVLSLLVGSIAALVQTDVKRMLAYSSISHAGFILIGVQAATGRGRAAALFYLLCYAFMVAGSFAVVALVAKRGDRATTLDEYRGLGTRRPVLAATLALLLFAQAGVPFTAGFVAKLQVFSAAVAAHSYALALVGVLASAIAAFLYLRITVAMYMSDGEGEPTGRGLRMDPGTAIVLVAACAVTLWVGFLPGTFLHFAHQATLLF